MDKDKIKAFADKVFSDMAGAMTAGMGYIGVTNGLFRAMAGKGGMRVEDVARETKLVPRYVEEWLKGMTCAKYVEYDPAAQTYLLPDEHAYLLASDDSDHFMGGLFPIMPVLLGLVPDVATAFRHGGGVPFEKFGPEGVFGLDVMNRGQYENRLTSYWLKAMPDVQARLEAGGRALDVGCGAGRIAVTLAKAFPSAKVVGLDPDRESIRQAEAGAAKAGLSGRVSFVASTTGEFDAGEGFDLITACDCIHDFAAPQPTLKEIRALLKPEGTLFIIEPRAADKLEDNINPIATMLYGFSIFHCMTQSLAQGGPGLGTCMGPARTEKLLREAGFREFRQLEIKSPTNLFYAARA
jgi:2-polyprenyl-3-methyl-5-hydroxy-6-metoxy-1,4-benzoquinol methylase